MLQRIAVILFAACLGLLFSSAGKSVRPFPKAAAPAPICEPPLLTLAPFEKPEKPPFKRKVIVIDAGHGGDDLGTQSTSKPRYKEKHLNLATVKMLERFLQQMGYKIVLTRHNDTFLTLERRAEIANNLHSDLFISVHYNSAPSKQARGIEVFYYRDEKDKNRAVSSKLLASYVLQMLIKSTEANSRGVKYADLSVIRNTTMPAILIEGGFLTNEEELQQLKDPCYLKRIAWGIAQGIQAYLER